MSETAVVKSFRDRVIKGGAWVFIGQILSQLLSLASNLIMTRILVPEMFGIMALANAFVFGLELVSDLGIHQNIIQSKRGNESRFLNTAWVVNIARGFIIAGIALGFIYSVHFLGFLTLLPDDSVFTDPQLIPVLAVISLTPIISGIQSTKLSVENRNLAFGHIIKITLISQLIAIFAMVCWAMFDRSIWALVCGTLTNALVMTVLSHTSLPGQNNRFEWDQTAFRELFTFGKWVFLSSAFGFLLEHGEKFILGGLVDAKTLGLYSIAALLALAAALVTQKFTEMVGLPAVSEIYREDPARFKKIYYNLRLPIDGLILLAVGFIFITGSLIVEILYDPRYIEAGYMLEIIVVTLFFDRFLMTNQCFLAIGKPSYYFLETVLRTVFLFVSIPVAFHFWDFIGALWAIALNGIISLPVLFYLKHKIGILSVSRELAVLAFLPVGAGLGYLVLEIFSFFQW